MTARATAAALVRARLLYERTGVPTTTVAAVAGLTRRGLDGRIMREGWRRRRTDRSRRRREPGAPASAGRPDRVATGRAMERFIAGRIASFEAAASSGRDADPERTARTVSHYARALSLIRGYLAEIQKDQTVDEPAARPRSLSELRDELRRHLERIWDESRAEPGD